MANNKFVWTGLDELRAALRDLPTELGNEAGQMVEASGNSAAFEIKSAYSAHRDSGNLMDHVSVDHEPRAAGAVSVVKSTARHAYIFENGTQIRKDSQGRNRGAMPPAHIFVPIMQRKRFALFEALKELVRRAGLEVRGA
jgi:hypothetical protein